MAAIALLTDFGTRDYYVGAMKGAILSIAPSVVIVDITHEVPPQDVGEAAYTLQACYRDFPAGTVFVAVVDPGVGSDRRALIVEAQGYYFVAPDNGLLTFVLEDDARVFDLTNERYFRDRVSNTFHGRDIFAPVAAHLSLGVRAGEFGTPVSDPLRRDGAKPRIYDSGIEGEVIHIDRFGNIVTNITVADLPAEYTVEVGGTVIENRREFYAGAEEREIFSIAGSAGFLEVSLREGSAADILGVKRGEKVSVAAA
jgi:S-adenosylmethionine hydrolase